MSEAEVKISYDALVHNARELQKTVGDFYAVLKCDAYGHGAKMCAQVLHEVGHRHFAVYSLEQAMQIKPYLRDADILIFGRTDVKYAPILRESRFIQTVFSDEYAEELAPSSFGVRVHIKLDTGMNRAGFKCHANEIKNAFFRFLGEIEGVYTHFHAADEPNLAVTQNQLDEFVKKSAELEALLGKRLTKHAASSAAALRFSEARLDFCRIGLALYGVLPDNCAEFCDLRPVMSLSAPIIDVRCVKKGENIGYGCDETAKRDTVCATASVGYANGIPRVLAGTFKPLLHGRRVDFIGRICMDRCMLDVTELFECGILVKPYDTVQLFGDKISVRDISAAENTIPYEVLTRVGRINKV